MVWREGKLVKSGATWERGVNVFMSGILFDFEINKA